MVRPSDRALLAEAAALRAAAARLEALVVSQALPQLSETQQRILEATRGAPVGVRAIALALRRDPASRSVRQGISNALQLLRAGGLVVLVGAKWVASAQ